MFVCLCGDVCVSAVPKETRVWDFLELELQTVVSCPMYVSGN